MKYPNTHPVYGPCWVDDTIYHDRDGYGVVTYEGKKVRAHRLSFFLWNGYWPNIARHQCDNPPCANPTHIEDGTHAQNMQDKVERGRTNNGKEDLTHCPNGHEYTTFTTRITDKGTRECVICDRLARRRAKRTNKETKRQRLLALRKERNI